MKTILKHTTAVAALAALPLAPLAVQAQSQTDQGAQSQSELVPSDKDIKIYKSQKDTAGERSEVIKKDGEYIERSTQAQQSGDAQQGEQQATGDQDKQTGQQAQGQQAAGEDAGVMQGQNTQAGVIPGTGPVQELTPQEQALAADALIATVGDTQIRRSDVLDVIALLPPQLQQQPAEMLIPMAIDQLVTRELILQQAREEGLEEDQEVTALTDAANEQSLDNAMVQVWLDRELEGAVTDDEVENTYETIKAQMGEGAPPLSQIRPQIEQELRRQAFAEISSDLHSEADITVYGPDGQPLTQ